MMTTTGTYTLGTRPCNACGSVCAAFIPCSCCGKCRNCGQSHYGSSNFNGGVGGYAWPYQTANGYAATPVTLPISVTANSTTPSGYIDDLKAAMVHANAQCSHPFPA